MMLNSKSHFPPSIQLAFMSQFKISPFELTNVFDGLQAIQKKIFAESVIIRRPMAKLENSTKRLPCSAPMQCME